MEIYTQYVSSTESKVLGEEYIQMIRKLQVISIYKSEDKTSCENNTHSLYGKLNTTDYKYLTKAS